MINIIKQIIDIVDFINAEIHVLNFDDNLDEKGVGIALFLSEITIVETFDLAGSILHMLSEDVDTAEYKVSVVVNEDNQSVIRVDPINLRE